MRHIPSAQTRQTCMHTVGIIWIMHLFDACSGASKGMGHEDTEPRENRAFPNVHTFESGAHALHKLFSREHTNEQGSISQPFTPITGPAAWYAADYKDNDAWIYRLTPADLSELETAVTSVERSGVDIKVLTSPTMSSIQILESGGSRKSAEPDW